MFNLFYVKDVEGKKRLMRAKKLHRAVICAGYLGDDRWLYNAKNVIKVCKNEKFPVKYRIDIESKLLDFYSMLLYCNDYSLKENKQNLAAVCKLYNTSAISKNLDLRASRKKFLTSYLEYITNLYRKNYTSDSNFKLVANAWVKRKYDKLSKRKELDFCALKPKLAKSFESLVTLLEDASILVSNNSKNRYSFNSEIRSNLKENSKAKKLVKTR